VERARIVVRRLVALTLVFCIVFSGGALSGQSVFFTNECSQQAQIVAQDGGSFNLTWTSREMSTPQLLGNGSSLEGDRIMLNATFLGHAGFVEPFNTSITIVGGSLNTSALGSTVSLDTYFLATNGSYSIELLTTDSLDQNASAVYEDVFLGNFFAPVVEVDEPVEVAEGVYNVTWACNDQNQDEVHFYDVWISTDGGVSYQLLARNLTLTWFVWNSSGFLVSTESIWRIRAYSVDFSLYAGPFLNLPSDYVPGDYGDGFFIGWNDGIPYWDNIGVSHPSDFTFTAGTSGQEIRWLLSFWGGIGIVGYELHYTVYRDDAIMITDTLAIASEEDQYIIVTLDGFSPGVHNMTLSFANPGPLGGVVADTVLVHVVAVTPGVEDLIVFVLAGTFVGVVVLALLAVLRRRG
jgi:hypothetical protein